MAEQSDLKSGSERRVYQRVPLDAPFFVTLRRSDGAEIPALMVDFGRGGVQVALPPGTPASFHSWLSCQVVVLGMPEPIECGRAGCKGMVSWVSAERCGVRFEPPLSLSEQELRNIVKSL